MKTRPWILPATAVVALALGGCTSEGASAPVPATSATSASPSDSASAPPSSPEAPAETAPEPDPDDPDAPAGQCADDALGVDVMPDPDGTGAGSVGYRIVFTNVGETECELRGFPGVSVVGDGDGTQLGVPADRPDGVAIATVRIPPGGEVAALLQSVNIAGGGGPLGCETAEGDGWRIYPPHSFRAFFVASSGLPACSDGEVFLHLEAPVTGL